MASSGVLAILESLTSGEVLILLVLALVVLGPERLPQTARSIGRWIARIRSMSSGLTGEIREVLDDPEMQPLREVGEFVAAPRRKLLQYAAEAEQEAEEARRLARQAQAAAEAAEAAAAAARANAEAADDAADAAETAAETAAEAADDAAEAAADAREPADDAIPDQPIPDEATTDEPVTDEAVTDGANPDESPDASEREAHTDS